LSPDDTVEIFPVAIIILPKQIVIQPDEGGLVVVPSAKTKKHNPQTNNCIKVVIQMI